MSINFCLFFKIFLLFGIHFPLEMVRSSLFCKSKKDPFQVKVQGFLLPN